MRRLVVALAAAAIAVSLVVVNISDEQAAVSAAENTCTVILRGTGETPNGDVNMRYWDPILFPGVYGYIRGGPAPWNQGIHGPAHWHTFFGNKSLNPYGIEDPFAESSCGPFAGNFWTPSLLAYTDPFPGGIRVDPVTVSYRFRSGPRAIDPPSGLGIIARGASWDCGPGTPATDVPHVCLSGSVQATLAFPRFWDGTNLHLPGEAHVSFTRVPGWERLPRLKLRVDFGIKNVVIQERVNSLSVGGVAIHQGTPGFPEFGPPFREDENSFHVDVLYAGGPVT